jgi:hypothetical protein
MADVRANVARMCDVCLVRRRLYFYRCSIEQAMCHSIRRQRDRVSAVGWIGVAST